MNETKDKRNNMSTAGVFSDGFSLVETLVAIAVLLVAIVGPMTIAAQGLQASFFAREQTTAVYLAQEAVEAIEEIRDVAALEAVYELSPRTWLLCQNSVYPNASTSPNICDTNTWEWYSDLNTLATCDKSDGSLGCDYDSVNDTFRSCGTTADCTLRKDTDFSSGRYYQYSEGDFSEFSRVIIVSDEATNSGNEVLVTVVVSWRASLFGGSNSNVTLQTRIFDQYE